MIEEEMGNETGSKKLEDPKSMKSNKMTQVTFLPQQPLACGSFEDYEGLLLWMRGRAVKLQFQSTALMSGLVALITAHHYTRISNSLVEAYIYQGVYDADGPVLNGVPLNDAYRYMEWSLTVFLLSIEILLVMKLDDAEFNSKSWSLGFSAAMTIVACYGESAVTSDLSPCWICWFVSMIFVCYIIYELLVGLATATAQEADPGIRSKIQTAQVMTVISWYTYPVVYLFPMLRVDAVTRILKKIEGVSAVEVDMEGQEVTVKGENLSALALGSNWLCTALSDVRSEGECSYIALSSSSLASVSFEFSSLSSSLSIAQLS